MIPLALSMLAVMGAFSAAAGEDASPEDLAPNAAYAFRPFAEDYATRHQAFLDHYAECSGSSWNAMVRMMRGQPADAGAVRNDLHSIDSRRDCADFRVLPMLRMLHQFGDSDKLSDELAAQIRESLLGFKYWPDEPGLDSMCSWTENHQIAFAAGAYMAGQLFPDAAFTNSGHTGREKMAQNRPRIVRWLDLRFQTGFSEWLSNDYYNPNLASMLLLVDFCDDEEIVKRATMVTDLLLADMALNSFHGSFCSTHGRSYQEDKRWADREHTTDAFRLVFGMGAYRGSGMGATSLALSPRYRIPSVIYAMATDFDRPEMLNRQRMGIKIEEAERWGLGFDDPEDGMVFLSMEAYAHPKTVDLVMNMFDLYHWWGNDFFKPFARQRDEIEKAREDGTLPLLVAAAQSDVGRNLRDEVNILTYRTPDYMLSTAQDYRAGMGGDQHHIWQATLAPNAVCFTTHPVSGYAHQETPGYWAGSGTLPRVSQIRNVTISVYNASTEPGMYVTDALDFTHAWVPRDSFDEVVERDGWIFARRGRGYLALRSQHPYRWQDEEGENKNREVIVDGTKNVWVCELGREAVDGPFTQFVDRIRGASISFEDLSVTYDSPSQGRLEFGWLGDLRQNGQETDLTDYPRYDNPYASVSFPNDEVTFRCGDHTLSLNWRTLEREASAFLEP